MTDLRTAINAVIKEWEHLLSEDASGTDGFAQWALNSNIEALRQALQAEPVELVAKIVHDLPNHIGWNPETKVNVLPENTPLYTTPPSIDALIAEISGLPQWEGGYNTGDVQDVFDKYRSKP